jgi:hypothetical protein
MRRDISWEGTNFWLQPNTARGPNRRSATAVVADAASEFPKRPPRRVLNESIPLFFISRDKNGFWIAREAEGTTGGIFLFKRSTLRFAERNSKPSGCAMMFLAAPRDLDVDNRATQLLLRRQSLSLRGAPTLRERVACVSQRCPCLTSGLATPVVPVSPAGSLANLTSFGMTRK